MCPGINYLIVTFLVGDETHVIVVGNFLNFTLSLTYDAGLLCRNDNIIKVERETCYVRHVVTKVLDTIKEIAGTSHSDHLNNIGDKTTQTLLRDNAIEETHLFGDNLIDDDTTDRSLDHTVHKLAVYKVVNNYLNLSVKVTAAFVVSDKRFFRTIECESFALSSRTNFSDIVKTEHHVL